MISRTETAILHPIENDLELKGTAMIHLKQDHNMLPHYALMGLWKPPRQNPGTSYCLYPTAHIGRRRWHAGMMWEAHQRARKSIIKEDRPGSQFMTNITSIQIHIPPI